MTIQSDERNLDDVGPGFMDYPARSVWQGIRSYLIGLALAVLLTVISFYLVGTDWIWGPALPAALAALAIAQIGVHLAFFSTSPRLRTIPTPCLRWLLACLSSR